MGMSSQQMTSISMWRRVSLFFKFLWSSLLLDGAHPAGYAPQFLVVQGWSVGVYAAFTASDASALLLMAPHDGHVSGSVPLPLAELSYFSVLAATSGPVEARRVLQLVRFYECRFCAGAGSVGALVGV